jgi:ribosomal protein S27AE
VGLGRLVCAAQLDEMNVAAQLRKDRKCPDCGELSLFAVLLHECGDAGR